MITIKLFGHMVMMCILLAGYNQKTEAQIQVTKGSRHKYSVTPLSNAAIYNYNWSVTGGTSSSFGTEATTNDILWDGAAGNYTITVYPTRPLTSCNGSGQQLEVSIVDMHISWSVTQSSQCPKTDNENGDFLISANYTGITGPWSFSYAIDHGTAQIVMVDDGNTSTITIKGFINTSTTTIAIHTIQITSLTTPDQYTFNFTGTESEAISRLYTVSVEPVPATTEIIQL